MAQPVDLTRIEFMENWADTNPDLHMRNAFPFFKGLGTADSVVVVFELDANKETGTHRDSAEEIVLVLDGDIEVRVGGDVLRLTARQIVVIPANEPHNVRNIGDATARVIGFFASGHVQSRFDEVLQPDNLSEFDTADIPL